MAPVTLECGCDVEFFPFSICVECNKALCACETGYGHDCEVD